MPAADVTAARPDLNSGVGTDTLRPRFKVPSQSVNALRSSPFLRRGANGDAADTAGTMEVVGRGGAAIGLKARGL